MSLLKIQANKLPPKNVIFNWNFLKEKIDIFEKLLSILKHDVTINHDFKSSLFRFLFLAQPQNFVHHYFWNWKVNGIFPFTRHRSFAIFSSSFSHVFPPFSSLWRLLLVDQFFLGPSTSPLTPRPARQLGSYLIKGEVKDSFPINSLIV